jgi:hypothetical protein
VTHHFFDSSGGGTSRAPAAFAAARGGAGAGGGGRAGGFGRGGGPGGAGGQINATVGSVANKHGRTPYVKDSDGNTIKVKMTSNSNINRTASTTAGAIHPGDTVIVQGTKSSNGTVTATQINATASAATSGFAGLFGGGGFGGVRGRWWRRGSSRRRRRGRRERERRRRLAPRARRAQEYQRIRGIGSGRRRAGTPERRSTSCVDRGVCRRCRLRMRVIMVTS